MNEVAAGSRLKFPLPERDGGARALLAMALLAMPFHAMACSPPPMTSDAGFYRSYATRLPKNAQGVMFFSPAGVPRASQFQLSSDSDKRTLSLRVRSIANSQLVRLEPIGGFKPGARYHFRYRSKHGAWSYPDTLSVSIDNASVDTVGHYALDLAPRLVQRIVHVPTSQGTCTKPVPVVVQAFSHRVPAALEAYRDVLDYYTVSSNVASGRQSQKEPITVEWNAHSEPVIETQMSFPRIGQANDAVIAPCYNRWKRVRLRSAVAFPELDDQVRSIGEVELDLSRAMPGECGELESLIQSLNAGTPDRVMREACGPSLDGRYRFGQLGLADFTIDDWERSLSFAFDMSPTCNLVALSQLWKTAHGSPAPAFVDRIAAALRQGFAGSDAGLRSQTVHGLAYLLLQLPERQRQDVGPRLVGPSLPILVEELGQPRPNRANEVAALIISGRRLPANLRRRVEQVAAGKTQAATHAKSVLQALPMGALAITRSRP